MFWWNSLAVALWGPRLSTMTHTLSTENVRTKLLRWAGAAFAICAFGFVAIVLAGLWATRAADSLTHCNADGTQCVSDCDPLTGFVATAEDDPCWPIQSPLSNWRRPVGAFWAKDYRPDVTAAERIASRSAMVASIVNRSADQIRRGVPLARNFPPCSDGPAFVCVADGVAYFENGVSVPIGDE